MTQPNADAGRRSEHGGDGVGRRCRLPWAARLHPGRWGCAPDDAPSAWTGRPPSGRVGRRCPRRLRSRRRADRPQRPGFCLPTPEELRKINAADTRPRALAARRGGSGAGGVGHEAARGVVAVGFLHALPGAAGATAAFAGHPEVAAQILQGTRTIAHRLVDLALGDGLADTDVHAGLPEKGPGESRFARMRSILNRIERSVKRGLFPDNRYPRPVRRNTGPARAGSRPPRAERSPLLGGGRLRRTGFNSNS